MHWWSCRLLFKSKVLGFSFPLVSFSNLIPLLFPVFPSQLCSKLDWREGLPRGCWWWRAHLPMQETQETPVWSLGGKDALEWARQPTPVFLLGESPWTEEPGRLQSMGSQRVVHDWSGWGLTRLEGGPSVPLSMTSVRKKCVIPFWTDLCLGRSRGLHPVSSCHGQLPGPPQLLLGCHSPPAVHPSRRGYKGRSFFKECVRGT